MRIAVVTPHPLSHGTLTEYGAHLVRALRATPGVSAVLLLADEPPSDQEDAAVGGAAAGAEASGLAPICILPCWRFGAWRNALRIAAAARRCRPDVVLFNIQFATFGPGPVAAALGLLASALVRACGIPTVVLLHNIIETVDLHATGYATRPLIARVVRCGGTLMTRLLLRADRVVVTLPRYATILQHKYGAANVVVIPHGTFDVTLPASPAPAGAEPVRLLTFGKFGTYKTVEPLIEAFLLVQGTGRPPLELVIAGTDSPHAPGYLAGVRARYRAVPGLRFIGYVAEEDLGRLFGAATVAVLPYTATTGSSGVLHLAAAYSVATVLPRLGDLDDLVSNDGYTGEFFTPGNVHSLATAITRLLDDPARRQAIATQNSAVARAWPLSVIAARYLQLFRHVCAQAREGRSGRAALHRTVRAAWSGSLAPSALRAAPLAPPGNDRPAGGTASTSCPLQLLDRTGA